MKNFRTYQLALDLYHHGQKFKISQPIIKDQFHRATLSIVLNLAEGTGKRTPKDRRRFYQMAFGSIRETQALLEIIPNSELANKADRVAANLYRLIENPGGQ